VAQLTRPQNVDREFVVALRTVMGHHPDSVKSARIEWFFSGAERGKKRGCQAWLRHRKATDTERFYTGDGDQSQGSELVIVLNQMSWQVADPKGRLRMLDHALSHLFFDDEAGTSGEWTFVAHDIGEFGAVLERYGADGEMVPALRKAQQIELPGLGPSEVQGTFVEADHTLPNEIVRNVTGCPYCKSDHTQVRMVAVDDQPGTYTWPCPDTGKQVTTILDAQGNPHLERELELNGDEPDGLSEQESAELRGRLASV
jgi:hypothetical protein